MRAIWRRLLLLWLVLAPIYALQVFLTYRGMGAPVSVERALGIAGQDALCWLALSPLLAFAVHWRADRLPLRMVGHVGLALLAAVLHVLLDMACEALVALVSGQPAPGAAFLVFLAGQKIGLNLVFYGLQLSWLLYWSRRPEAVPAVAATAVGEGERVLVVRDGARVLRLPVQDIRRIEAAGNYLAIQGDHGTEVVRMTLATAESALAGSPVVRVHRSVLLHAGRVRQLRTLAHGDAEALMDDGSVARVSRNWRARLEAALREDASP